MDVASTLAAIAFFAALAASVLAWLWGPPLVQAWRRWRIRRQPFPPAWREILRRRMPAFARLPADVQLQLKKHAQVLIAEKPFIGCQGLVVTEEMRVLVATQAALLLLNRRNGYFRNLRQVLLYPGAFVVDRVMPGPAGLAHDTRRVLAGESWQQGQLILSWDDVLAGAADPADGRNVVIHEFAHQLDQETGSARGLPIGIPAAARERWARVMSEAFEALQHSISRGEAGLIDAYGATDAAEFFAVTSELFFERPVELAARHPALYAELERAYAASPLHWQDSHATLVAPRAGAG